MRSYARIRGPIELVEESQMNIDELLAREEITAVLYLYCRGVDRGNRDDLANVYHPDAHDEHGEYQGGPAGFADYIIDKFDRSPEIGQHHITNAIIELDLPHDRARVESYFLALNPGTPEAGGGIEIGRAHV